MSEPQNGKKFPEMKEQPQAPQIDVESLVKTILENVPRSNGMTAEDIAAAIKAQNSIGHKHQAHNLSIEEMKRVKEAQMSSTVKMIQANKNSKYQIPEHEKHLMHYSTERTMFNAETGEKISKPRFHVSTVQDFTRMSKSVKESGAKINPENAFNGMKVTIYHDMREGMAGKSEAASAQSAVDMLQHMDDKGLRSVYLKTFGEESLPSDSKAIMIGLIKEKWATGTLAE